MCIAAVIFSLIPILSGYGVYLVFSTLITKGSPALQWTVGLLLAAVLVWAFVWAAGRIRRRAVAQRALDASEDERADVLEPPPYADSLTAPARDATQAPGH